MVVTPPRGTVRPMDMITPAGDGVDLAVWVVPGAGRSEITGRRGEALRVRVAAPAAGGRANEALLKIIHEALGGRVSLVRGGRSRSKVLHVEGIAIDEARCLLGL